MNEYFILVLLANSSCFSFLLIRNNQLTCLSNTCLSNVVNAILPQTFMLKHFCLNLFMTKTTHVSGNAYIKLQLLFANFIKR